MKLFCFIQCLIVRGLQFAPKNTDSSLTVLIRTRLYCVFFFPQHTAYVLKFIVLILVLAAREIKSTAEGGKMLIKGIYFMRKL